MLFENALSGTAVVYVEGVVGAHHVPKTRDLRLHEVKARSVEQNKVKAAIMQLEREKVRVGVRLAHGLVVSLHRCNVVGTNACARGPQEFCLEHTTHEIDLANIVNIETSDGVAHVWSVHDDAFFGQLGKRFAHRDSANAQILGHLYLTDMFTRQ